MASLMPVPAVSSASAGAENLEDAVEIQLDADTVIGDAKFSTSLRAALTECGGRSGERYLMALPIRLEQPTMHSAGIRDVDGGAAPDGQG
jgi:hypothetical protein